MATKKKKGKLTQKLTAKAEFVPRELKEPSGKITPHQNFPLAMAGVD